ncbi:aminotransferase class V-fold PLP-dependent enzyme [Dyadobacter sp. CY327]|uniref:cysteine desulfurase family protein n=1 Tax=Dyadobacter sp. CY327 TaxID=2907301 RepID=UPI001F3493BE|nr:aminotransferase class V-fold PLP-dependent enzyme [Dyadobacter sp. CY327]MCE7070969.1 aminotransferase class V-fold PLP-dependent enzyme [Dyadobacter sp. CY327]
MTLKLPVYLDNNATTPMDPAVLEEMLPYFSEKFGNAASRTHSYGWEAEEAVDIARENIASLIGAHPQEIVFTSGATEAANLAIKGVWENNPDQKGHIITVVSEHKAVLDTCKYIERKGGSVTYLEIQPNGLVDLNDLEKAITPQTLLIAVMYANNETGVIQPIKAISAIAKAHGVLFFTDATQAVGKIPVDVQEDDIDLLAFSAHKLYGPKGVGALYVRKKNPTVTLTAQIEGGGHERNMRSGTLNVAGVVAFGKACEICAEKMASESLRLRSLRDHFEKQLLALQHIDINAGTAPRLPHATNISFHDIDGEKMIFEAGSDIAFSRSSACTSATLEPSYVLKAMGLSNELIHNTFRFSFGRFSTEQQVDHAVAVISKIVKEHRG